MCLLFVF
jgi:hypothetical protein